MWEHSGINNKLHEKIQICDWFICMSIDCALIFRLVFGMAFFLIKPDFYKYTSFTAQRNELANEL